MTVDFYVTHPDPDQTYSYFQVKHCDDLGIHADKSSTLFLFLGIFATLGRLGGGFLCNMRFIKVGLLQQSAAFIVGSSTMLLILAKTYALMVLYVITFGFADGIMVTSLIIECIQSVEESKRASAFGFFMLVGGVIGITSPPLAGSLNLINICCVLILLLSHPIRQSEKSMRPCIHPYIHAFLYPSMHLCIHTPCIHPCILVSIHAYIHHISIHASMHPCITEYPLPPSFVPSLLWSVGRSVVISFVLQSVYLRPSTPP